MSKRPTTTTSPRSATATTRSSRRSTSCAPQDAPKAHASEARSPPRSLHSRANSPCPRSSRVAAPDDLRERRPREGGLLQSPGERVTTAQPPGLLLLVRSERSMPELSDARLDGRKGACPLVRTTPAAVSRCMERGVVALLLALPRVQASPAVGAVCSCSTVAAQLPRRLSASSDLEPGSAVKVRRFR